MKPYLQQIQYDFDAEVKTFRILEAILANKEQIQECAEKYKKGEFDELRDVVFYNLGLEYRFSLNNGMCYTVGFWSIADSLRWAIVMSYLNKPEAEFEFNEDIEEEAIIESIDAYPVDGYAGYTFDKRNRTVWLNSKRWEFVEYVYAALQSQLKGII